MARKTRNEVAVGITVLIVLVLAIYIVVMLADWSGLSVPQQKVTVRVHYKVGLKGLQVGSPIHLGGVKIGHITNTQTARTNCDRFQPSVRVFYYEDTSTISVAS
jgi:ABC-type transporter Mla subunit MlaD